MEKIFTPAHMAREVLARVPVLARAALGRWGGLSVRRPEGGNAHALEVAWRSRARRNIARCRSHSWAQRGLTRRHRAVNDERSERDIIGDAGELPRSIFSLATRPWGHLIRPALANRSECGRSDPSDGGPEPAAEFV